LLGALLEKYIHPQGVTTEEAMRSIREENSELYERWRQRLHNNESRPFIEVQHYHTREDVESAFLVLSARHQARPTTGRKKRDELTAVRSMRHSARPSQPPRPRGRTAATMGV
jgi:hypothetical protein